MKKTVLNIKIQVDSLMEGKELLNDLEVLQEKFEINVELSIKTTPDLFQVIPE
jgi:hypothetical protein